MKGCATFLILVYHTFGSKHDSDAPHIVVKPRPILLIGEEVIIECSSSVVSYCQYHLIKDGKPLNNRYVINGSSAEFSIQSIQMEYNGMFRCGYTIVMKNFSSRLSNPIHITVLASLPKPLIRIPDEILEAQTITINCTSSYSYWELVFILYQGPTEKQQQSVPSGNCKATFLLKSISLKDEGSYTCQYKTLSPVVISVISDIGQLTIAGHYPAPRIIMNTSSLLLQGESTMISCFCDSCQMVYLRFELNKNEKPVCYIDKKNAYMAEFHISNISKEDTGYYSCSYINLDNYYRSGNSRLIQVTVGDGTSPMHYANNSNSSNTKYSEDGTSPMHCAKDSDPSNAKYSEAATSPMYYANNSNSKYSEDSNFTVFNKIRFGICAIVIVLMVCFILEARYQDKPALFCMKVC